MWRGHSAARAFPSAIALVYIRQGARSKRDLSGPVSAPNAHHKEGMAPMKSITVMLLSALAFVSPAIAADLRDDLLAAEKTSWTAWGNRDVKAFGALVAEDAVSIFADGTAVRGREKILADVGSHTCKLKSFNFSDANLRQPSPDAAILTYTATQDVTCAEGKSPPRIFVTAMYARQGGKWRWVNYQETAIE